MAARIRVICHWTTRSTDPPSTLHPNRLAGGRSGAVRWGHRRLSRHQRRASGRTAPHQGLTRTGRVGPSQPLTKRSAPAARAPASEVVPRRRSRPRAHDEHAGAHHRDEQALPEGLHRRPRRRPLQPALPGDRGGGPRLLGRRRHLPRQHRPARPGPRRGQRVRLLRRPAVRQRAAALRPPADRVRQGPDPALPHDARPAGGAPLRLGHPRAAGGAGGDAPQGHQDHRRDPRARHRDLQRRVPAVGAEVHRRVARLRHPPGALGGLRQRLQAP